MDQMTADEADLADCRAENRANNKMQMMVDG